VSQRLQPGDWIVYRMAKHSTCPGPRAKDVRPAPHGDDYTYVVDKYWVVAEVRPNGEIVAETHRGKRHLVRADDPALKRATWWEQLFHGGRFPARHESKSVSGAGNGGA